MTNKSIEELMAEAEQRMRRDLMTALALYIQALKLLHRAVHVLQSKPEPELEVWLRGQHRQVVARAQHCRQLLLTQYHHTTTGGDPSPGLSDVEKAAASPKLNSEHLSPEHKPAGDDSIQIPQHPERGDVSGPGATSGKVVALAKTSFETGTEQVVSVKSILWGAAEKCRQQAHIKTALGQADQGQKSAARAHNLMWAALLECQ
eukprot:CAMPEP_0113940620 /NCGR_PEP_ID=MMETSP1339-20121228/6719_1 /TAXON_ID=94617 /ORGANISM="Fibrocapsa japonica" /LENGTH=203 /DNA_ID=CAMNT_0000944513 /DNA_START=8 /DNA_END=619 /DNA_ORIENTATION=+ /assembly_acc=CAM_ASM_000762